MCITACTCSRMCDLVLVSFSFSCGCALHVLSLREGMSLCFVVDSVGLLSFPEGFLVYSGTRCL